MRVLTEAEYDALLDEHTEMLVDEIRDDVLELVDDDRQPEAVDLVDEEVAHTVYHGSHVEGFHLQDCEMVFLASIVQHSDVARHTGYYSESDSELHAERAVMEAARYCMTTDLKSRVMSELRDAIDAAKH
jgi:hypothetical protein